MMVWGVLMHMESGHITVSNLVFEKREAAVTHSETLERCADVVGVEVMAYNIIKG